MKRSVILFACLSLIPGCLHAEESSDGLAETLFEHILDSEVMHLFPLLPGIRLPFGISVHLVMLFLALALITVMALLAVRKPRLKPGLIQNALEFIVLFVRDDIVYPIMGPVRGEKWLPFFSTMFLLLLVLNYIGMVPAFKAATGNFTVTTALALAVFVLIFVIGFKNLGLIGFFRNMYPSGSPPPIGIFVVILEFAGNIIKAMVLSIRLFANMFAGHLAILSFLVLIFLLSPFMGFIAVPFALFISLLEVLVALIQAFVFTLLSCIFISMASTSHEH